MQKTHSSSIQLLRDAAINSQAMKGRTLIKKFLDALQLITLNTPFLALKDWQDEKGHFIQGDLITTIKENIM